MFQKVSWGGGWLGVGGVVLRFVSYILLNCSINMIGCFLSAHVESGFQRAERRGSSLSVDTCMRAWIERGLCVDTRGTTSRLGILIVEYLEKYR